MALNGGTWNSYSDKKYRVCTNKKPKEHNNLFKCCQINKDGKTVQVWHPHGDAFRSSSIVLGYYSYAKCIGQLSQYNKDLSNKIKEAQETETDIKIMSWLDWFIIADVYMVGFGFDFSEFDIWWALERKAREYADVGKLTYFSSNQNLELKTMLEAMNADYVAYEVWNKNFDRHYENVINHIKKQMENNV